MREGGELTWGGQRWVAARAVAAAEAARGRGPELSQGAEVKRSSRWRVAGFPYHP